jgi:myo-inositol 2-dehydrogenase/D-chiro-inositol 1-dehydrogenase
MERKEKLRFGIIGVGRIGKVHIENLTYRIPDAEVVVAADTFSDELRKTANQFSIPHTFSSYKDILKNEDVDAVVICSPTDTHAQIIQEAAAFGKHIFCEKPIDLSIENIIKTLDIVAKYNVKFQVQASGGMFLDMTIHDFDMARYLIKSEIEEIFVKGNVLIDPVFKEAGDIDTAVISLTFANGTLGTINNSRKAVYGYDQRVEVFGSEGMVMVKNDTPDSHILLDSKGSHEALPLNFFMERYTESYYREIRAFIDCVFKDTPSPVSGKDGLLAVIIGLAAKKSMNEGRPVKVNEVYKIN